MASENLLSIELNAHELQQIDKALSDLEMVTQNKFINLTPDERKEYSRIGHKTEDWIVRVKNYMEQYPELVMKHIDTTEFYKDFEVRQALLPRLRRLNAIFNRFEDTAMLIGSDLYHSGIVFYRGAKVAAQTNAPNAQTVYADLQKQFPGRTSKSKKNEENNPKTDNNTPETGK